MKKYLLALLVCALLGGAVAALPKTASADASPDAEKPDVIRVATDLTWEGDPTCGWTQDGTNKPKVGVDVGTGQAIVVNGKTYGENAISTHLPATNVDQDIDYDISDYSDEYDMFEVWVAQPDGDSSNWPKFVVLADGVEKDFAYYRSSALEGADYPRSPILLRANVKGAQKLTLRVHWYDSTGWEAPNFSCGRCAFLEPTLYRSADRIDAGRVYASELPFTATPSGWFGYYNGRAMLDSKADGTDLVYWEGAPDGDVRFAKGIGVHLKDVPYSTYESDKSNSANYVSLKWNIAGKGFDFFNTAVYMAAGDGVHADIWVDGEELQCSPLIRSTTSLEEGVFAGYTGLTVNAKIPEGAKEFEVRIIAEKGLSNGKVELCDAAFFDSSELLWSRYAEETRSEHWPHPLARGDMWDGRANSVWLDGEKTLAEHSLYGLVGTEYLFDIEGLSYNYFHAVAALCSHYGEDKNASVIFKADVTYADDTTKTYESERVTYANSGVAFDFVYDPQNAKTLKLYWGGEFAYSDSVYVAPALGNKLKITYDLGGGETDEAYFDVNGTTVAPATPERTGYTFRHWYLENEDTPYTFGSALGEDITLHAAWMPNEYTVTVVTELDGEAETESLYEPFTHTYGTDTSFPATVEKEGYTFNGWYFEGEKVEKLGGLAITDNASVTASYTINVYDVTFRSGIESNVAHVRHGQCAEEPGAPAKEGYTFLGWFTDEACEHKYDFETEVTGDITLYAGFAANATDPGTDPGTTDPGTTEEPSKPDEKPAESGGCGSVVAMGSAGIAAAVILLAAVLVLVVKKSRKGR